MTAESQKKYYEIQKEFERLEEKYRVKRTVTQEDLDHGLKSFLRNYKIGDPITTNPILSKDDPKEAFEIFANYYATQVCLSLQQIYVQEHDGWNITELELEIEPLKSFRRDAQYVNDTRSENSNTPDSIVSFNKISNGYYNVYPVDDYEKVSLAQVYGKYVLYFDFLEEKILQIFTSGHFSKLDQIKQIDKILTILCNKIEYGIGYSISDIKQILKKDNLIISSELLDEILHKLDADGFLRIKSSPAYIGGNRIGDVLYYSVSFEGRFFKSQGGYKGDNDRNNSKNTRLENLENDQKYHRKRATELTAILCAFSFLMALFEMIKMTIDKNKEYAAKGLDIFVAVLLFAFGICAGIMIYKLIPNRKE